MRILITGKNGQLGYDLCRLLKEKEDITAIGREDFDLATDLDKLYKFILELKPEVIIHCAAYTKVDDCEKNIDLAYKINAVAPARIASACADTGSRMVYISTDYVFDGKKEEPYMEFDTPSPLNVYGSTKLAGEEMVRHITNRHYIVRTSWLFGIHGHNFVKTMLKLASERKALKVVNDQRGTPTYTKDLAEALYRLINTNHYGTFHITNSGSTTWYEFAGKIFDLCGMDGIELQPITTEEYGSPALRPKYSVLRNFITEEILNIKMRDWEEGLRDYLIEAGISIRR
ncbi:MAG: dTDP-4-dehydrorhamnose reductase [Thermoanaerobacteraceae bacterium]|jgi:dTDP-4-dehydrorhamnose reductase|nr:dTDP-4-dehydrorhamnose reductase [Thermoanaerobacteraceae bacterium]